MQKIICWLFVLVHLFTAQRWDLTLFCPIFFIFFCIEMKSERDAGTDLHQTRNQAIFNTIRWVNGSMGQTTHRPRVWCSKYYFFFIISYRLRALKTLYFYFGKVKKKYKNKLEELTWQDSQNMNLLNINIEWMNARCKI